MTIKRNPRILVFDSGVGGLSIVREIQRQRPGCDLIYASDNAAFPYGTKGESELVSRVDQVLHRLLAHSPADILVIACNTASTLTLPHVRRHFSQPVVGVVPAIKPAAALSRSKVIGLMATPATVERPYTLQLIRDYAANCTVIPLGNAELVQLAEAKLRGITPDMKRLKAITAPFTEHRDGAKMDTVVLACTHFPLLRDELSQCLGSHIALVDSGEAIARRVDYWLDTMQLNGSHQPERHLALFTRDSKEIAELRPALADLAIDALDVVPV
ncbi:glutamate racemase [Marinimicrobium sp. ABcell2]|uniref:glutamate racemase n=1 Tax=Marinimicrobium sp. ABcell2 TaxID=3069751 RepID=UPI0027AF3342|nr:glutamate racemase [Marinimicrobium sp. ABcell2]MDQ2078022.1 glutamate racemase [Marinimicrobium sp. ABcell2]